MNSKYLPEIDGLRAIAVLAVLAYHAGAGGAGFVGVDIFFVISGYLITSLLFQDIAVKGRPDVLDFYARRLRRILPAATVVIIASAWAGNILLSPAEMKAFFQSAAAAFIFSANIFFQLFTGDYFDAPAAQMPLLHLWSLGVEEQFYLIWPLALIWITRTRYPRLVVMLTAGISLMLAQTMMYWYPEWAFYQMPTRYWELAVGGLIALGPRKRLPCWVSAAGLLMTIAACLYSLPQFPGIGALPAVIGAAMICAAAHGASNMGPAGFILRSRPMVGVGLISYSLYLWHWPLLAFYRVTSVGETSVAARVVLCAVALLLAVASYRYIEQPFRRMKRDNRNTVISGVTISAMFCISAGIIGLQPEPPDPFPLATQAQKSLPPQGCRYRWDEIKVPKCPDPVEATVAIWGDSMAYAWRPAMPLPVVDLSHDSCPPLLDWLPEQPHRGDFICREFESAAVRHIGGQPTLVIVARWQLTGTQPLALKRTLETVSAKVRRVILIGPTPEMRDTVPRCIRNRAEAECAIPRAVFDKKAAPILAELRQAASGLPNVTVVDVSEYFCTPTVCPPIKNGIPLYWDSHHPTKIAVEKAKEFEPLISALLNPKQ